MARKRLLSIGFFENEELAQLPDKARLLFAGLWLLADRAGRLEDRPLRIRGQVFPYEMVDCDVLLTHLAGGGFIRRYVVGDQRIIAIPKFLVHQNPHIREPESRLPAFSQCLGSADARTMPASDAHSSSPAVLDPVIDPVSDPETVKERTTPPALRPRAARPKQSLVPEGFAEFWDAYPLRVSRLAAERAWSKLSPNAGLQARIKAAVEAQRATLTFLKDGQAATWLTGARWEDDTVKVSDPTDAVWDSLEARVNSRSMS